jgi:hypothetical protein
MKKLLPLFLLIAFASCKKESISPDQTKQFIIHSNSNGGDYSIKVALPENYNGDTRKYSTIYLLDGEENFESVANKCKEISNDHSVSNVIVVSIGYGNDRAVDYTPTKTDAGDGGAEAFMLFIKNELIPKIESDFNADTTRSSRVILGHSFGGLFGAYAFANFNNVFGNYLLLSPSLWYDNEIVLHQELTNRNLNKNNHQLVYLGLGQMENEGRMLAPFMSFYQILTSNYQDIKIKYHLVPHLDHMGSKNPNIEEGLEFYFQNR